ncbi:PREDICTED: juvenile hormone epoxide hydrolase-like, partial [Nicrophorus vespilloides]|uniref:Juvenile hormone epoxide hydrolase-like n=1 Tax=Nicrophorus vespilloides TaxID=110193 RepID=A0ABM1M731_NICVS
MVYFLNYMQGNFISLDSLSITLSSSPIALASYIWNIISVGTDLEEYNNQLFGALQNMDEEKLIDVVMLMTISQSTTNSIRSLQQFVPMPLYQYPISTKVPCSCPKFTKQIFYQASWIYKDKFTNVVQATNFQEWGHRMLFQTDK